MRSVGNSLAGVSIGVEATDFEPDTPVLVETERQLRAYCARDLRVFDLPLAPAGTAFQREVWSLLLKIPYAAVTNYGQLAIELGNKNLSRAVGAANGANPIAIIIPCHRVIGKDGDLVGYAGGLSLKQALLEHEQGLAQLQLEF